MQAQYFISRWRENVVAYVAMAPDIRILLADDDKDDQFLFDIALRELPLRTTLSIVGDGEKLMDYLSVNTGSLPDVLFMDLNMPRRTGLQCIADIKNNKELQHLPVVAYSTSVHEDTADFLYGTGAHYYIQKTHMGNFQRLLQAILLRIKKKEFKRPARADFILRDSLDRL
jgi:CheY-like chemotaxis protein